MLAEPSLTLRYFLLHLGGTRFVSLKRSTDQQILRSTDTDRWICLLGSFTDGLVVSVLISGSLQSPMPLYQGFVQLGAGLSVGLAGLSAGFAIGIVGDAGVRGTAQQPRLFVG
jgi:hypothetical protein